MSKTLLFGGKVEQSNTKTFRYLGEGTLYCHLGGNVVHCCQKANPKKGQDQTLSLSPHPPREPGEFYELFEGPMVEMNGCTASAVPADAVKLGKLVVQHDGSLAAASCD